MNCALRNYVHIYEANLLISVEADITFSCDGCEDTKHMLGSKSERLFMRNVGYAPVSCFYLKTTAAAFYLPLETPVSFIRPDISRSPRKQSNTPMKIQI